MCLLASHDQTSANYVLSSSHHLYYIQFFIFNEASILLLSWDGLGKFFIIKCKKGDSKFHVFSNDI